MQIKFPPYRLLRLCMERRQCSASWVSPLFRMIWRGQSRALRGDALPFAYTSDPSFTYCSERRVTCQFRSMAWFFFVNGSPGTASAGGALIGPHGDGVDEAPEGAARDRVMPCPSRGKWRPRAQIRKRRCSCRRIWPFRRRSPCRRSRRRCGCCFPAPRRAPRCAHNRVPGR